MNFCPTEQLILYFDHFGVDQKIISVISNLLDKNSNICSRTTIPAHITASAITLNEKREALMIKHPSLNKWLPPGGHIDEGEFPQHSAIREFKEEIGHLGYLHNAHNLKPWPIDIDIHAIPENKTKNEPAHWHVDFRYLIQLGPHIGTPEHLWEYRLPDEQSTDSLRNVFKRYERFIGC